MRRNANGYYTNRHSCFLLQYHLVLVTKFRHPVITCEVEDCLREYTMEYFKDRDMRIIAMECMPDHVHILFECMPQVNPAEMVNAFKSGSSRRIRKLYGEKLKPFYWKPYFWSLSYFIGSVSERTTTAVRKYIDSQKG